MYLVYIVIDQIHQLLNKLQKSTVFFIIKMIGGTWVTILCYEA
jgi:hypothetical protein